MLDAELFEGATNLCEAMFVDLSPSFCEKDVVFATVTSFREMRKESKPPRQLGEVIALQTFVDKKFLLTKEIH